MLKAGLTSLAIVFAAACTGCPSGAGEGASRSNDVTIGVVSALTGPNAQYGVPMRDGIDLAIRGHEDTFFGRKLRAIYFDDRSRTAEAALAAQRLVVDEKVDLLLGEVSSSGSAAMAPVAERAKIPMISPSATDPVLTELGAFVFRICFTDPQQARAMAKFAREQLSIESVAVVRDLDSEYSVGLAKSFTEAFTKLGGRVVLEAHFSREGEDYRALIAKIARAEPQAIYLPAYANEVAQLARAAREAKLTARWLGSDGFDAPRLIELLEGAHFTTHYAKEEPGAENTKFIAAYAEAFNEAPGALAALGYDAANLAIAALARAGTRDKIALREAIAATAGFEGVTGRISFDSHRNAIKPAVVITIAGGERKFVARMAPE